MFKFLRKYNKYILAVGGTLLLITFLIPFAFTDLLQGVRRNRATWATVNDDHPTKVKMSELGRIQRELQLIQYLAPQFSAEGLDRADYWYLLTREAEQSGFVGAAALPPQFDAQTLGRLAAATGEQAQFVARTMARIQGVATMLQAYVASDRYSDHRLRERARHLFHRATIRPVFLEASTPREPQTFTEEQMLEQMTKYAEVAPGEGDMGFGYRLPDRVKLEWLVIPAESVRSMIEETGQLNAVDLRKHWRREYEQRGRFGPPDPDAPVPQDVRNDLEDELTTDSLNEIARYANDQLRIARRGLTHRSGYLVLPEGWSGLRFEDLALDLQENFDIALPEYHAVGDRWLTAPELGDLPGIGQATTDKFGDPVDLRQLTMAAKEFGGSPTIPIQKGVAGPPLRGADGSIYLFRIIDDDASRAPESVDEVREQVVADLNRLAAYNELVASADDIRQAALNEGLVAVALEHDTSVRFPVSVTLADPRMLFQQGVVQPTILPIIGADEPTVSAIIDHAMSLPEDTAVASLPAEQRTLVIPVENRLVVLVAELTDQQPLTAEAYRAYAQGGTIQMALESEDLADFNPLENAYSYEALAERHNFHLVREEEEAPQEPTTPGAEGEEQKTDEVARVG
jgi:hypothetical protein